MFRLAILLLALLAWVTLPACTAQVSVESEYLIVPVFDVEVTGDFATVSGRTNPGAKIEVRCLHQVVCAHTDVHGCFEAVVRLRSGWNVITATASYQGETVVYQKEIQCRTGLHR